MNTMFQKILVVWSGYRFQPDKTCAGTRFSATCGKFKCQTRKNVCIAYTQVNTHAFSSLSLCPPLALCLLFFFLNETLSRRRHTSPEKLRVPLPQRRLKFISLTPDKPPPSSHAQEATRCNQSLRRLSRPGFRKIDIDTNTSPFCPHTPNTKRTPESTLTNSLTSCG